MSVRESALECWLTQQLKHNHYTLSLLAGDASFRRYYRILYQNQSWVVMDAPPQYEPIIPFMNVANLLSSNRIHVPKIIAADQEQGFILLEDLGDTSLLDAINANSADKYYHQALDLLVQMQSIPTNQTNLNHYNAKKIVTELQLFIEWFCQKYLQINLSQEEHVMLNMTFIDLATHISEQPTCFMHRDYHSRNIMVDNQNPLLLRIIDFQDALIGPYAYDVVSLLKDCYINWPDDQQQQWCQYYFKHSQFNSKRSFEQFMLDYHMCGLQRHLRVLGTFSRLYLRDGKNRYLADMPRILNFIDNALTSIGQYPALQTFLNDRVRLS